MRAEALAVLDARSLADPMMAEAVAQLAAVASLSGLAGRVVALPNLRAGVGFPRGVAAAFDRADADLVAGLGPAEPYPAGIRLLRSDVPVADLANHLGDVTSRLHAALLGWLRRRGADGPDAAELRQVLAEGASWLVRRGLMPDESAVVHRLDGSHAGIADGGVVAVPARVEAVGVGAAVDVCYVERVHDTDAARPLGLELHRACVLLRVGAPRRLSGRERPGRWLPAVAGIREGAALAARAATSRLGFADRQRLAFDVRAAFSAAFGRPWTDLGLWTAHDGGHGGTAVEVHRVDGRERSLLVHRRSLAPAPPAGSTDPSSGRRGAPRPALLRGAERGTVLVLAGTATGLSECFASLPAAVPANGPVGPREIVAVLAGAGLALPVARLRRLATVTVGSPRRGRRRGTGT